MKKAILNETPVRTSKSFGINNIQLDELLIPDVQEFKNVQIKSEIEVSNKKNICSIKYEIEKKLTTQIIEKANQDLSINVPENTNITTPITIEITLTNGYYEV